jgi:uncharacterized protein (DUF1778 family)
MAGLSVRTDSRVSEVRVLAVEIIEEDRRVCLDERGGQALVELLGVVATCEG